MVNGLWVHGFVRVVGTRGSIYRKVFSTRGWFYYFVFLFIYFVCLRYALRLFFTGFYNSCAGKRQPAQLSQALSDGLTKITSPPTSVHACLTRKRFNRTSCLVTKTAPRQKCAQLGGRLKTWRVTTAKPPSNTTAARIWDTPEDAPLYIIRKHFRTCFLFL